MFDPPGSEATLPSAINANGWIGGWYEDITGIYGFMRAPSGNLTKIDVRGSGCAATTAVTALNSQNIAVGVGYDSSCVQSAFIRAADGTITTFEEPGATLTEAVSINDAGAICGFYNLSSGSSGFVRSPGGKMT